MTIPLKPKKIGFKRFYRNFKGEPGQSRKSRRAAAKAMWKILHKRGV